MEEKDFEIGYFRNLTLTLDRVIGYDTIEEINVDSKAEYTA